MKRRNLKATVESVEKMIEHYYKIISTDHDLSDTEMTVLSHIVGRYLQFNRSLDAALGYHGRETISKNLNITREYLTVIIGRLRTKGMLGKDFIPPLAIPPIENNQIHLNYDIYANDIADRPGEVHDHSGVERINAS